MISVAPPSIVTTQHPHGEEIAIEIEPKLSEKHVQLKLKKRVKRLLLKPENQKCLDCSSVKPKWATLITVPPMHGQSVITFDSSAKAAAIQPDTYYIGGFCCLECSGAHRRLGTHITFVRSVDLDTLKEHEVKALENGGNQLVNQIYEGTLRPEAMNNDESQPTTKPTSTSEQKAREAFIKSKYEQKKYLSIKDMANFRQKMIHKCNSRMSSPTMSEVSDMSPMSQNSNDKQVTSPTMQLQIFTSSPRTLAMIEKYMNPAPKKKGLNKLKPFKRFSKKRFVKNSVKNLRRDGVGVNHTLNIMQARSAEEEISSNSPNEGVGNDAASVNSVKSSMSATFRRSLIRGAKVLTPNFSKLKVSSTQKKKILKNSRSPLLPSSHATQNNDDHDTPSSQKQLHMNRRNKKTLPHHHESKVQRPFSRSKKEGFNPTSPPSSTGSFRERFSKMLRTPKRTPNSLQGENEKQKNRIFFPEDLDVVKESNANGEFDVNSLNGDNKKDEIKAMKQWAKKFDKVFEKLGKGTSKRKGSRVDSKTIGLAGSDDTAHLLPSEGSDDFETWRSDGNFSTRLCMKTSNRE